MFAHVIHITGTGVYQFFPEEQDCEAEANLTVLRNAGFVATSQLRKFAEVTGRTDVYLKHLAHRIVVAIDPTDKQEAEMELAFAHWYIALVEALAA